MGLMATAIGKEAMAPLVPDVMQAALKVKQARRHLPA